MLIDVDKDNFNEEVKEADGLVVVDFWSPGCEKCKELLPEIKGLEDKFNGNVKFCKLNIQGNRRLALALGVRGLPAVQFYKKGEKVAFIGPDEISPEAVESRIKELV